MCVFIPKIFVPFNIWFSFLSGIISTRILFAEVSGAFWEGLALLPNEREPLLFGQVVDRDLFKKTRLNAPPRPKHIYLEADFDLLL